MNARRLTLGPTTLGILLLSVAAGYCGHRHWAARGAYEAARRALETAASLADQIALLRTKPDRAALESRSERTLADSIERAAVESGVPQQQIARIEPLAPRRAGESDYLEHATEVQLDGARLEQLAAMLARLRLDAKLGRVAPSAVRISTPYQQNPDGPELWNVELTLTYLVYSPKTAAAP